ncbi:hypothetical protein EYZ11_009627 [Aspergillus tanneri]|uniref:Uncharacterized protein n=1 Tax=Aspergillus tanneri TaxID=1220188 RepID=A0A4S3J7L5_9EURO|nr:hypothetical protein EYZ11_009627 [Aspergillus tanneri]
MGIPVTVPSGFHRTVTLNGMVISAGRRPSVAPHKSELALDGSGLAGR